MQTEIAGWSKKEIFMINDERIKKVLYGGDYNPEQWPMEQTR